MHSYNVVREDGTAFSVQASSFHLSGEGIMFSRQTDLGDAFSPSFYTHWYKTSDIVSIVIDESIQI